MVFQLNFSEPLDISPIEIHDKLVFHIREEGQYLFTSVKNKRLDPLKHTMRSKIRRQMKNSALNRGIEESAEKGETSLKILLVITFLINFLLPGSGLYFIMMIRSL